MPVSAARVGCRTCAASEGVITGFQYELEDWLCKTDPAAISQLAAASGNQVVLTFTVPVHCSIPFVVRETGGHHTTGNGNAALSATGTTASLTVAFSQSGTSAQLSSVTSSVTLGTVTYSFNGVASLPQITSQLKPILLKEMEGKLSKDAFPKAVTALVAALNDLLSKVCEQSWSRCAPCILLGRRITVSSKLGVRGWDSAPSRTTWLVVPRPARHVASDSEGPSSTSRWHLGGIMMAGEY